jgi:GGDEF domain-containing protein
LSAPASPLNVNVACLACDGSRPCAECRAAGRTLAASGHRVHYSSRYAALRAAADGTYGFPACIVPVRGHERSISDSIISLLGDAQVAIAAEDPAAFAQPLPSNVLVFPRSDFLAGTLPRGWPRDPDHHAVRERVNVVPERSSGDRASAARSSTPRAKDDATRRLRAMAQPQRALLTDAAALLNDELAWYRASGLGFAVMAFSVAGEAAATTAQTLIAAARTDDAIRVTEYGCVAILTGADASIAKRIGARLSAALRKRTSAARAKVSTGVALCPDDGATTNALLAAAHERLRAR